MLRNALQKASKKREFSSYKLNLLREELFMNLDQCLDENPNGPYWLNNDEIAKLVLDSLKFNDEKLYSLWGATIMPNHVHALMSTMENATPLNTILQNHKKYTAGRANKILEREGSFWQRESFNKIVWNPDQFENVMEYIINNPVKAKLTDDWRKWPWTYVHPLIAPQFG